MSFEFIDTVEGVTLVRPAQGHYAPRPATDVELALRERITVLERLLAARREHCRRVHGCENGP